MRLRGVDGHDWEPVRVFTRRWEAELAQSLLSSHGVPVRLHSDDTGGIAYPNLGLVTGYALLVPVEEMDAAAELLDISAPEADPSPAGSGGNLGGLLLELLTFMSVTGSEQALADWLSARYTSAGEAVQRLGDSLVVGEEDPDRPNVLLVSHIDVVPPTDADLQPRREDERIVGRGASDMKSGLAVAMDCFEDPGLRAGPFNLLLVCYAREEGSHDDNELGPLLAQVPELSDADLAIVLEPTDLAVQLGCMGALHAEVSFVGKAAHSARPWEGENALTKAGGFLTQLAERSPEDVEVDGLVFREVFTATQAWTASARNVVPDRFTVNLNYRFAPDKSVEQAEARLRELVDGRAEISIVDRAPAGSPRRDAPLVEALIAGLDAPIQPKQAWTDVARFSEVGVAAVNYGPGLTAQAHQAGEWVPEANLHAARDALARFLSSPNGGR
ncbi:MAG TPA: succinyl-diaminopimelate desuccinylase [Egibacteraceae bacterium]|nr:succinyl-diaminopimelate desuccinylase [Egibacteraceae bacterium]